MSSRYTAPVPPPTIRQVLSEYFETRAATLEQREVSAYRRILFFLELCINNYGHRNLPEDERALCERHYREPGCERHFFEVFGPEKLLPELDFFAEIYVRQNVYTSERIEEKASYVVDDLRLWLVERGYVSHGEVEASKALARERSKLGRRTRRAARLLAQSAVRVDPLFFADRDYIDTDDHPITRIGPGRFWLRVYRNTEPEDIGPLLAPEAARSHFVSGGTSAVRSRAYRDAGASSAWTRSIQTSWQHQRQGHWHETRMLARIGTELEGGDK